MPKRGLSDSHTTSPEQNHTNTGRALTSNCEIPGTRARKRKKPSQHCTPHGTPPLTEKGGWQCTELFLLSPEAVVNLIEDWSGINSSDSLELLSHMVSQKDRGPMVACSFTVGITVAMIQQSIAEVAAHFDGMCSLSDETVWVGSVGSSTLLVTDHASLNALRLGGMAIFVSSIVPSKRTAMMYPVLVRNVFYRPKLIDTGFTGPCASRIGMYGLVKAMAYCLGGKRLVREVVKPNDPLFDSYWLLAHAAQCWPTYSDVWVNAVESDSDMKVALASIIAVRRPHIIANSAVCMLQDKFRLADSAYISSLRTFFPEVESALSYLSLSGSPAFPGGCHSLIDDAAIERNYPEHVDQESFGIPVHVVLACFAASNLVTLAESKALFSAMRPCKEKYPYKPVRYSNSHRLTGICDVRNNHALLPPYSESFPCSPPDPADEARVSFRALGPLNACLGEAAPTEECIEQVNAACMGRVRQGSIFGCMPTHLAASNLERLMRVLEWASMRTNPGVHSADQGIGPADFDICELMMSDSCEGMLPVAFRKEKVLGRDKDDDVLVYYERCLFLKEPP